MPENEPKRIQRKRTRGWRMPAGAVYVGRPTKWGNRFKVGDGWDMVFVWHLPSWSEADTRDGITKLTRATAVELFREKCCNGVLLSDALYELHGKNLACWCPLVDANGNKVPCHADVLLEWANSDSGVLP